PMIGRSCVSNVRASVARHVAVDAAVRGIALPSLTRRHGTADLTLGLIVTFQAGGAIVPLTLLGSDMDVRVVASGAAHLQLADRTPNAFALVHLLDVVARLGVLAALPRLNEHCPEVVQGQTGPIVEQAPSRTEDARLAFQMALFAHRVAQSGRQAAGVDDGV